MGFMASRLQVPFSLRGKSRHAYVIMFEGIGSFVSLTLCLFAIYNNFSTVQHRIFIEVGVILIGINLLWTLFQLIGVGSYQLKKKKKLKLTWKIVRLFAGLSLLVSAICLAFISLDIYCWSHFAVTPLPKFNSTIPWEDLSNNNTCGHVLCHHFCFRCRDAGFVGPNSLHLCRNTRTNALTSLTIFLVLCAFLFIWMIMSQLKSVRAGWILKLIQGLAALTFVVYFFFSAVPFLHMRFLFLPTLQVF